MSYFSKLQQNVIVSAGNTSLVGTTLDAYTGNPPGGADTYIGTSQDTLGVAGIQVNLRCDNNCKVYVYQSMDGSNWDIIDTYNYYGVYGGQSWTTQATASFVKVYVQNLELDATTVFRLQTALCPIVEAVPRALSSEGNLKVGVYEIEGNFGTKVEVTPMNSLKVMQATRLVGSAFGGGAFDTNFWIKTATTGTASITVSGRVCTLATNPTGVGSGNSAILNSVRTARYAPGHNNYARIVVRAPSVTGVNTRRWGSFNANDGYYFHHNGTTLSIGSRSGGVDASLVSSGSFNGVLGSTLVIDANVHTYEIHWTNRSVWYFYDGELLHKKTATTTPLTATNHLQIGFECTNGANTNNNTLEIWAASINRSGVLLNQPQSVRINTLTTTVCKYGPGNLHEIIVGTMPTGDGLVTIYDNITNTGTVIWAGVLRTPNNQNPAFAIDFKGLPFNIGLCIVTATNATDLTVVYE
jgi:hypothetical protein